MMQRMKRKSCSVLSVPAQQTSFTQAGFTLVELLVVMVILGLLVALVAPNYIGRVDKSKREAARTQVENFGAALDMFRLDVGRYPSSQEGLDALRQRPSGLDRWDGPYLKKDIPRDPWGNGYVYRSPGEREAYELISLGPDGVAGGSDENMDINSWENS